MNNVNESQVQSTNDASTISKHSAVTKNYFEDDFIQEFINRKKSRASLIHLGYYSRAIIIHKLISLFIEFITSQKLPKVSLLDFKVQNFMKFQFQIVSLGAGFDTSYWRLTNSNVFPSSFVEIDFVSVIQKKIELIKRSGKLKSYLSDMNKWKTEGGVHKLSWNYYLIEADLCDVESIEQHFEKINVDFNHPTLFVSECVITYMKESDSRELIQWIAKKFKNSALMNYEQIHPNDGFGEVMMEHFNKLQSPLFSVREYPNCDSHLIRYRNLVSGFDKSYSLTEWEALVWLTNRNEIQRALSLELFDEFEEFHLKCVHYVIALAGNGIGSLWIDSYSKKTDREEISRRILKVKVQECELELFRHSMCSVKGSGFVFGGCNRQGRSSVVRKINYDDFHVEELSTKDDPKPTLDLVYGSVVYFELNKTSYVCVYGGRTSPDKVWNDGCPVVYELQDGKFILKCVVKEGNPIPRYRSPMVCLNETQNEVSCWVFGGRTPDLGVVLDDLWELKLKEDNQKNLSYSWKKHKTTRNRPAGRMSHSLTPNPEKHELIMAGGLKVDTSTILNDIWKWKKQSDSWEEVEVAGAVLPRYGHTAHLHKEELYLVGGVNTLGGMQPGVGRIHLANKMAVEYNIQVDFVRPVLLFNHASDFVAEDDDDLRIYVVGGGGNCFSFGTHLNSCAMCIHLNSLN